MTGGRTKFPVEELGWAAKLRVWYKLLFGLEVAGVLQDDVCSVLVLP